MITLTLFAIGIALVGISSLGRMWCSLYIAGDKDESLMTQSPYSACRNPLYFFGMMSKKLGFQSILDNSEK